jgi:hypothetical protein
VQVPLHPVQFPLHPVQLVHAVTQAPTQPLEQSLFDVLFMLFASCAVMYPSDIVICVCFTRLEVALTG